jgi:hypothetical protein
MASALGASYCHSDPDPAPIATDGPASCPSFLDLELDGTHSTFKPGWTGNAHGAVALDDKSRWTVAASCDDQCRRCSLSGPVRGPGGVLQRCLTDITKTCGGSGDAACPGPGGDAANCRFMLPPIESDVAGGNVTCNVAYFDVPPGDGTGVSGVIDLLTGETDLATLKLRVQVAIGGSCPTCEGDPTPNDGLAQGECTNGSAACDIQGFKVKGYSLDCPIAFGATPYRISMAANHTSTALHVWTLDATHPACSTGTGSNVWNGHCWCGVCNSAGVCSDAAHEACSSNNNCPAGVACTLQACSSNLDCPPGVTCGGGLANFQLGDNSCPDDCGSGGKCGSSSGSNEGLDCFPDTLNSTFAATGSASVIRGGYQITLANLVCVPPHDPSADLVSGVPGPLWFQAAFTITPRSL